MCLSKGAFVIACLLMGVIGTFFLALSTTIPSRRIFLVFVGSFAITGCIVGISVLQHNIVCDANLLLY